MPKRRRAALLPTNIALLQNLVRRDPGSYKEEFLVQYRHYASQIEILLLDPTTFHDIESFIEQVGFIAQVCPLYPVDTAEFPGEIADLLSKHHTVISAELREKLVQSLVLLRNRGVITSDRLIQVLFPLLTTSNSKSFRKDIFTTLVRLLKHENRNAKAPKLNRSVQTLLFTLLESSDGVAASPYGLWAAKLTRELWRRGIWDDARAVEIMKQAALHGNTKVAIAGVLFFLSADKEKEKTAKRKQGLIDSDDDSSDDGGASSDDDAGAQPQIAGLKHRMGVNKKSGRRAKRLENAKKILKRKENRDNLPVQLNFSALHLLHDPQGFAEKLFAQSLSRSGANKFNLEQRIQILTLVSRLIGVHKLSVLGVYSYILKYLTPKQRDVTKFMACAAQASHDLVPPDVLSPVIRKIADEFVSDGVAPEVAAAGINTIREILTRSPLAIEADLLQDLTEYKGSKSKTVMMAARSLIGLYRTVAPELLARKDRGKTAAMEMSANAANGVDKRLKYGVENIVEGVPGLELLEKWRQEQGLDTTNENGEGVVGKSEDDGWNVEDDEEGSEGWIDVESDKEYDVSDVEDAGDEDDDGAGSDKDSDVVGSDNEDDAEPAAKKAKTSTTAAATAATNTAQDPALSLMATKILTPADFQKLDELRTKAGIDKILGTKTPASTANISAARNEELVEATSLLGPRSQRAEREERMEKVMEGRQDREFGSKRSRKKDAKEHSTTNREKARKKNFIMMIHKKDVQGKNKRSLRDKQKILQAHIEKQKKTTKH
ncbi:SDA1-domain-containing protein [Limtongia smithiae]|uniref:SDA1-domain-containing protein n=1 Tax=Limtongia smithiae TaxID=1125753 RepID=UPI0034CE9050